jgi:hypothetical protein
MSNKPSLDYLGKVTGNVKQGVNVHTVKADEVMLPKPKANSEGVIGLKINLD